MMKAKGLYFLKLELDVFDNLKIKALLKNYGAAGFTFFIYIATKLYRANDCRLEYSDFTFDALSFDDFNTSERVKQFIDDCISKFRLFQKDGGCFHCPHVDEAVEEFENAKGQYSTYGKMGAEKRWGKNLPEETPQEEPKQDKKVHPYPDLSNITMTKEEFSRLVDKFGEDGTKERCEELSFAIESKGYKYKSHYFTILNWDRRNNKEKGSGAHQGHTGRSHKTTDAERRAGLMPKFKAQV